MLILVTCYACDPDTCLCHNIIHVMHVTETCNTCKTEICISVTFRLGLMMKSQESANQGLNVPAFAWVAMVTAMVTRQNTTSRVTIYL